MREKFLEARDSTFMVNELKNESILRHVGHCLLGDIG